MSPHEAEARKAEQRLADSLAELERRLHEATGETMPDDPERLIAELGIHAQELSRLVRDAERVLTESPTAENGGRWSIAFDALVRDELGGVLEAVQFPVVCTTSCERACLAGGLEEGPKRIRAALRRALMLACSFAGPGGEIVVKTGELDDLVTLDLTARSQSDHTALAGATGVELRSRSLTEFIEELGGQLEIAVEADGGLRIVVDFERVVG